MVNISEERVSVLTEEGLDFDFYKDGLVQIKMDKKLIQIPAAQWKYLMDVRSKFMRDD